MGEEKEFVDTATGHGSQASSARGRSDAIPYNEPDFSKIDGKRLLRRIDMRLIPALAVLYLLCFLDRGSVGNARIQHMDAELGLVSNQYNIALTVFFLTYTTFELPSNLLLKKLKPSIWLPSIMVAWGTCTTLTGIVQNYHGLVIVRLFLGIAEAGLYPGVAYFITEWYPRSEAAFRQSMFFSGASLAGAFSGLLAYGIARMDAIGNVSGWRWIFILEGILTVVVGIISFWWLYDFPDTASFLSTEEKAWVLYRVKNQSSIATTRKIGEQENFEWKQVWEAASDWQILAGLFMYWGFVVPLYGISYFLPTILKQLGYTAEVAQLLTIPIYVAACAIALLVGWHSDKTGKRFPYVLCLLLLAASGFVLALAGSTHNVPGLVYAGVFFISVGIYSGFPAQVQWIGSNLAGSYKRAAGMAIHIGIGNFGGAIGSNLYRTQDSPRFVLGHALSLMFVVLGVIATLVLKFNYDRINKKRDQLSLENGAFTDEELLRMGDRAPTFRYQL